MTEKLKDGSILVRTTDDLQDALDAARPGDVLVLGPGKHRLRRGPTEITTKLQIIEPKRKKKPN